MAVTRDVILCILGGGRSSRFGSSKLWLRVAGRPVVSLLRDRLLRAAGGRAAACWLNLPPGAPLPPGTGGFDRVLRDARPFAGPLAGMACVLAAAPRRSIVVFAAADMPLIDAAELSNMIAALRAAPRPKGVMHRWSNGAKAGAVEPLPSVWRAGAALRLMRQALAAGVSGPAHLAGRRGIACLPLGDPRDANSMLNINTRGDMAVISKLAALALDVA